MPRKPPLALRIVNRLGKLAPGDLKALLDATDRLRSAGGDELREAMHDQREALTRLADAAGRGALEEGSKLTLTLQRRVLNTVRAAAVSEPKALREGTLEHELQPSGFDTLAGAPPPRPPRSTAREDSERAAAERKEKARLARELRKLEQVAHKAEAHAQKLAHEADRAEEAARQARARAEEARRTAGEAAARALELRQKQ